MKLSNVVLGAFLALSFSNIALAAGDTKAEVAKKDCPTQTVTSAYIAYKKTSHDANLGKLYENYTNKIKALPATGHFTNFKIVSQNIRTDPVFRSVEDQQVSIDFTIEFDLNYQAVTEIASLKASDITINTFELKRCK